MGCVCGNKTNLMYTTQTHCVVTFFVKDAMLVSLGQKCLHPTVPTVWPTLSSEAYSRKYRVCQMHLSMHVKILQKQELCQQRAIAPKVWCLELWFLCTAFNLDEVYLPMKFQVSGLNTFTKF